MKLDTYAITKIAPYMTGHEPIGANFTGEELVDLFNQYGGFRDVRLNGKLPEINKGLNTSKKQYATDRMQKMVDNERLANLIEIIIQNAADNEKCADKINEIISPCGYNVEKHDEVYKISGLRVIKKEAIKSTASFQKIQNDILYTLDKAQISIYVAVAWLTNEILFNKLVEKANHGVDVRIVINNDGINKKSGVNLSQLNVVAIRSERNGLMHDKFCVIDNQIVISGSYNWTNNAEYKNSENINITENNNRFATNYTLEFNRLWNLGSHKKSSDN